MNLKILSAKWPGWYELTAERDIIVALANTTFVTGTYDF